jgi:hypothetical protein
MTSWISVPGHKGMTRTVLIWLLLGVCVVVFVTVVLRSPKKAEREGVKTEAVQSPVKEPVAEKPVSKEAVQQEVVAQKKQRYAESTEAENDLVETKTMQGRVTGIDPDMEMVQIDGVLFQTASYDSSGVQTRSVDLTGIRLGHQVKVIYTEKRYGKVIDSIEDLSPQRPKEEVLPEEVLPEKERLERLRRQKQATEAEVQTEDKPVEEIQEAGTGERQTIEGRVTGIDPDMAIIVVNGITFEAASYDSTGLQTRLFEVTGFQIDDVVRVTYTKEKHGNMAESIQLIERR